MALVAIKDFSAFLELVFQCKNNDLKPIEKLISEGLLDEDYRTVEPMNESIPERYLAIKTLDTNPSTTKKYLAIIDGKVVGKSRPYLEWKILKHGEQDEYQILNKNSQLLIVEKDQVVLNKSTEAHEFKWVITKEKTEDGIGWIISTAKATNLCVTYRYENPWWGAEKAWIELVDKRVQESEKERLWRFEC